MSNHNYCEQCGEIINKEGKFCTSCGGVATSQNGDLKMSKYKKIEKLLFTYSGCITRSEFWIGTLLLVSFPFIILIITKILAIFLSENLNNPIFNLLIIIMASYQIIMIYSFFCIWIKRYHDLGYSGWYSIINFLLFAIVEKANTENPILVFVPYISFVLLIFLGFVKGGKGEKYEKLQDKDYPELIGVLLAVILVTIFLITASFIFSDKNSLQSAYLKQNIDLGGLPSLDSKIYKKIGLQKSAEINSETVTVTALINESRTNQYVFKLNFENKTVVFNIPEDSTIPTETYSCSLMLDINNWTCNDGKGNIGLKNGDFFSYQDAEIRKNYNLSYEVIKSNY